VLLSQIFAKHHQMLKAKGATVAGFATFRALARAILPKLIFSLT
jgi:hypothetical protein